MRTVASVFGRNIFKRTQKLEEKITAFLLNIVQAGVLYEQAMDIYTRAKASADFIDLRDRVSELESQNDSFRREIENDMYEYMILPDMRSDILKLAEGCDKIINKYQSNLLIVSIEQPELSADLHEDLLKMVHTDLECADSLISGVRDFYGGQGVGEYTRRVCEFEHLVDKQAFHLKKRVYERQDISLARQIQLKEFIYHIEKISDIAEDVADILTIMAVKHSL